MDWVGLDGLGLGSLCGAIVRASLCDADNILAAAAKCSEPHFYMATISYNIAMDVYTHQRTWECKYCFVISSDPLEPGFRTRKYLRNFEMLSAS